MDMKIQKEIRLLKSYAIVTTMFLGLLLFLGFRIQTQKPKFEEIDVERINIIEKDGSLRLVISNKERSPGAIVNGRLLYKGGGRPGMIFFNNEGDECGGLTYNSGKKDEKYSAFGGITFDRYDQDQVVGLQYSERQGKRVRAGLTIWDRPDTPITEIADKMEAIEKMQGEEKEKALQEFQEAVKRGEFGAVRMFVGSLNETATVSLKDSQSRDRLRLSVDSSGAAKLEFLSEKGEVIFSLPPKE